MGIDSSTKCAPRDLGTETAAVRTNLSAPPPPSCSYYQYDDDDEDEEEAEKNRVRECDEKSIST